ncbi:thiamine pyrophosphate-dependent enzyme [Fuchsiella alkaliacetigena]|uniref:thiamine pyrophosphate-dependent enzyme n=1 Tax=Fuchsiella alkaliacetigena TaxID=957042 RepID=UPI00200A715D|nr:thiamine pyrophosphate-dependent enzyme [Fuchsiella alkaliacetigena]MCK8825074.1 thiamine pyrophosphate-dependent enzyme [Fuchsiella alkaliacetigena]
MSIKELYQGDKETAWCPGCGNFAIRKSLIEALSELEIKPTEVVMFTGIGQAAKMPHHLRINGFNGLHGRALPPAIGQRIANPELKTIVESGEGDTYGEGGNHLLHNIRRNPDLAHLVHNNQVYGLTKGQASPTSEADTSTLIQPQGVTAEPFNPIKFAVAMEASFVARSFSGDTEHLKKTIKAALEHPGYALVDILQPCVSFNKVNTLQWYQERVYQLEDDYDPYDYSTALKRAEEWGAKIPIGIIYKQEKTIFKDRFPQLDEAPLVEKDFDTEKLEDLLVDFE